MEFITAEDAAKLYGCTKGRIYQLTAKEGLTCYKKYGRMLFDRQEVLRMAEQKVPRRGRIKGGIDNDR